MNYETTLETGQSRPLSPGGEALPEDEAERRSPWRLALIVLAVIAALALAFFMLTSGEEEATPFAPEENSQAPSITVITPGRATIEGEIATTGVLAARRETPVGVVGEGGRVTAVPFDEGDWVRKGQVMVSIDRSVQNQQVDSAQAQIQVAQADANLAQANLDRALKLVDRGFISRADVDRLTSTRDAAVARVRVAQAQVRELRERNARLSVVAPVSGLILSRAVEPGQVVGGGSPPLFTIANNGEMELEAQVSEADLKSLAIGTQAQVTPVGTDTAFTGQVWQIAPTIDDQTRQGIARIALSYQPGLRPGGFASALISSGTIVAPMLPESAIQSDDDGSFVYVVGADNKVERREVTTGLITADGIAVIEGLSGSERIVLRAAGFLNPGQEIKPVRQAASSARPSAKTAPRAKAASKASPSPKTSPAAKAQ